MRQVVQISQEDSRRIQILLEVYHSYLNILHYLINQAGIDENNKYIDQKFNEALLCNLELESLKTKIAKQYYPSGDWTSYSYNFDNNTLEYYNV